MLKSVLTGDTQDLMQTMNQNKTAQFCFYFLPFRQLSSIIEVGTCQNQLIAYFGFDKLYLPCCLPALFHLHYSLSSPAFHISQISVSCLSVDTKTEKEVQRLTRALQLRTKTVHKTNKQTNKKMTQKNKETYKQADKHVLFGVIYRPFVILVFIVLFSDQWQIGVMDVVVIEAAMETAG